MRQLSIVLGLTVWCSAVGQTSINDRVPPPELAFVQEFVREMKEFQNLQEQAEKDLSKTKGGSDNLLAFIHWATAVQMAARDDISMLKGMNLTGDNQDTPRSLAELHEMRIQILEHMKELDKKMLRGPQPGVDYTTVMTDTTESRAGLERLNSTLVNPMSGLVFMALVDAEHPDAQNHASFLIISKKEKRELVKSLAFTTGAASTNSPFQNAGGVVYDQLVKKRWKCADDRPP